MRLELRRHVFTEKHTAGDLLIDGVFECYVLEDRYRGDAPKVPGKTCIPNGTYDVVINMSPRFKRRMPLLLDVPGFTGIRIHPGNTAEHTEGCLLPGRVLTEHGVLYSVPVYEALLAKLEAAQARDEDITITISTPAVRS